MLRYYYPNRPTLVPADADDPMNPSSDFLDSLEAQNRFLAELKYNGDNIQWHTDTNTFWNREHERHRYQPTDAVQEELQMWRDASGPALINLELMHYHTTDVKDTLIVHCVMAWQGEYLMGKTWGDSRNILDDCLDRGLSGERVRISPVWRNGFWELFKEADGRAIEGIVLKDPKGKLVYSAREPDDVNYMLKIRKACKKYPF